MTTTEYSATSPIVAAADTIWRKAGVRRTDRRALAHELAGELAAATEAHVVRRARRILLLLLGPHATPDLSSFRLTWCRAYRGNSDTPLGIGRRCCGSERGYGYRT